jgi:predicted protein tyrosine phosphatase
VVPFKLTICGIAELDRFSRSGVSHVLSILDPAEPEPAAFFSYDAHHRLELRFHDVIEEAPGIVPPTTEHVIDLLSFGARLDREHAPTHLLVHCHLGVSRSTASMMLLLAQASPRAAAGDIAAEVARIRPIAWPNLRMVEFGDALLGRKGALIDAAHAMYKRRAAEAPEMAELIRKAGRAAELSRI